ncbi:zinc finger BED domain-containing protein RICESLEEPER 2 [Tanacetum coccineum]
MILQCPPSYEQYLKADFVSHLHPKDFATFDVLGFWKAKENQFPVLSHMAMDILSVQASSVASESAFSTSGTSGEPRHDYMMSSGAEDDQTGDGHDGSMSHGYY